MNALHPTSSRPDADTGWTGPSDFPASWRPAFLAYTEPPNSETFALRAAIRIARVRKRTGRGPTFGELFDYLGRLAAPTETLSERELKLAQFAFRHHVAVHWRRRGWISWNHSTRSLRTGHRFRHASRTWTRDHRIADTDTPRV